MEQKKNEKDVLVVRDEKTGEIGVVSGLHSDGTPKMTPATGANQKNFLTFDKNSNALESFFENFYRQCKEPKRFGFYRVAAKNIGEVIDVFRDMLKDNETNKDMLAPHRIDTSKYEQQAEQVAKEIKPIPDESNDLNPFWQAVEDHWFPDEKKPGEEEQKQSQEPEQTQTEESEQAVQEPEEQGYRPIDESRIDWQDLEEVYGIKRETLEQSGDLDKMLNYGKSALVSISPYFAGERFEVEARLSFKEIPGGIISIVPHTIRKEPKLDEEFNGYVFSPEDKENLIKTGNMGRVAELVDKETGEIIPSFISIDRLTNEVTSIAVKDVPIATRIGRTELSEQEVSELRAGRAIPNKEIVLSDTRKFTATLQVNVERQGVEFVPRNKQPKQEKKQRASERPSQQTSQQTTRQPAQQPAQQPNASTQKEAQPKVYKHQWEDGNGNIRAPKTLGGVELTPEQQQKFTEGKAIFVKDMMRDGKGEPYTAFVKYSHEAGKPKYYRTNPDMAYKQEVAPTAESRTQVAVNTDGKTNEATKNLKEPLQRGQTQPTERQDREQRQQSNKPKRLKV